MSKVLIVDESRELRELVKFPLLYAHFEVSEAMDAMEALGILQHHVFDLVITDLDMPQVDGIGFIRKIRQDTLLSQLPILLLTTSAEKHRHTEAFGAGASDILERPFEIEKLVSKVGKLIATK
jgi:two-component system, chemotaxis family, chemotaxis protein CheY